MSDCIEWTGARTRDGYGHRTIKGRQFRVHRLAWEAANGPIPDGLWVLHRCDNQPCINPDHLFLGTQMDNMRDMVAKGRGRHPDMKGEASPHARLTQTQVDDIRRLYAAGDVTQAALGRTFNVCKQHIAHIVTGRRWASTISN